MPSTALVSCPGCGHRVPAAVGVPVTCPGCGKPFTMKPKAAATTPAGPPANNWSDLTYAGVAVVWVAWLCLALWAGYLLFDGMSPLGNGPAESQLVRSTLLMPKILGAFVFVYAIDRLLSPSRSG